MTEYRLVAEPAADLDVIAAFDWYEAQRSGLGLEFLEELRSAYDRIVEGPLRYQDLQSGVRRTLLRRFPYAVYFAVEGEVIVVVLAGLHAHRDPAEWQRRPAHNPRGFTSGSSARVGRRRGGRETP